VIDASQFYGTLSVKGQSLIISRQASETKTQMKAMVYYVYLLEDTLEKSWYIGYTTDLNQRVKNHNEGKGGKTTRQKQSWKLIYFEGYRNEKDALGRERFLKSGSGRRFLKKQLKWYLEQYKTAG
jgi:putative endonuclease